MKTKIIFLLSLLILLLMLISIVSAQTPSTPVTPDNTVADNTVAADPSPAERVPGVTPNPARLVAKTEIEQVVQDRKGDFGLMLMRDKVVQSKVCGIVAIVFAAVLFLAGLIILTTDPGGLDAPSAWGLLIFGIIILLISVYIISGSDNGAALNILSNQDIPILR
jgi:hypothetical protein